MNLLPKVSSRGVIQFTRHVTITRKCLKSIAERIEHGANIDDQDYLSGNVPFHFPISFGHIGILKLLIYWRNHLVWEWFHHSENDTSLWEWGSFWEWYHSFWEWALFSERYHIQIWGQNFGLLNLLYIRTLIWTQSVN